MGFLYLECAPLLYELVKKKNPQKKKMKATSEWDLSPKTANGNLCPDGTFKNREALPQESSVCDYKTSIFGNCSHVHYIKTSKNLTQLPLTLFLSAGNLYSLLFFFCFPNKRFGHVPESNSSFLMLHTHCGRCRNLNERSLLESVVLLSSSQLDAAAPKFIPWSFPFPPQEMEHLTSRFYGARRIQGNLTFFFGRCVLFISL